MIDLNNIDKENKLTHDDYELIRVYLDYIYDFADKAILKFIRGRIEHHNEDVSQLNFQEEIEQENMDIIAYNFLQQYYDEKRTNS